MASVNITRQVLLKLICIDCSLCFCSHGINFVLTADMLLPEMVLSINLSVNDY